MIRILDIYVSLNANIPTKPRRLNISLARALASALTPCSLIKLNVVIMSIRFNKLKTRRAL